MTPSLGPAIAVADAGLTGSKSPTDEKSKRPKQMRLVATSELQPPTILRQRILASEEKKEKSTHIQKMVSH